MMDFQRRALDNVTLKPTKSIWVTLRRFTGYFRPYWHGLILVVIFLAISTYVAVLAPELIGQAIDCYLFPSPVAGDCWFGPSDPTDSAAQAAGLTTLVLTLLAVYIMDSLMTGLSFFTMRWTGQNVLRDLRNEVFQHIHRLSLGYYARNEAGQVMSRLTNDMDTLQQMFNFALISMIRGLALMVFIIVAMLRQNVPYALLALVTVPAMLIATATLSTQARREFRKAREKIGNINAGLQESIAGAREVQAFNRETQTIAQFTDSNQANRQANIRAAMFTSALNPVLEALNFVSLALVVVVGGLSALRNEPFLGGGVISLGLIFAFLTYLQRLNEPLRQIAILWTNIQSGIAGGERIFGLMDEPLEIVDQPGAKAMPPINGAVKFDNVWVEYVPGEPVLRGVSLEAAPGKIIAIVGPTGAGKTTIINLIPRFYDVKDGAVTIDGLNVKSVTLDSLRGQIGMVLQDTFLFSTTVMDNIRYGRLDATDEEVIAAAKLVAAHDFIERLPEGYQTVLGERGSGLSQGQRQLIAIARVALMNPRILILDEATSSVDTRTERVIQRAFERLMDGRTTFVIAHRLSTIKHADEVLMLRAGEVIERGTHQHLLTQRGAYYDLYMSQFRDEEDDAPADKSAQIAEPVGD